MRKLFPVTYRTWIDQNQATSFPPAQQLKVTVRFVRQQGNTFFSLVLVSQTLYTFLHMHHKPYHNHCLQNSVLFPPPFFLSSDMGNGRYSVTEKSVMHI